MYDWNKPTPVGTMHALLLLCCSASWDTNIDLSVFWFQTVQTLTTAGATLGTSTPTKGKAFDLQLWLAGTWEILQDAGLYQFVPALRYPIISMPGLAEPHPAYA